MPESQKASPGNITVVCSRRIHDWEKEMFFFPSIYKQIIDFQNQYEHKGYFSKQKHKQKSLSMKNVQKLTGDRDQW